MEASVKPASPETGKDDGVKIQGIISQLEAERRRHKKGPHRAAVSYSIARLSKKSSEYLDRGEAQKFLAEPSYVLDKLEQLQPQLTDPDKVVVRAGRSADLNEASCVLQVDQVIFEDPSEEYQYGSLSVDSSSSVKLESILNGCYSADAFENGATKKWLIGKETVRAQLKSWYTLRPGSNNGALNDYFTKSNAPRVFNACVDIAMEKDIDFIEEDEDIGGFIDAHQETITDCLFLQVQEHVMSYIEGSTKKSLPRLGKYFFAFQTLGFEGEALPEALVTYLDEYKNRGGNLVSDQLDRLSEIQSISMIYLSKYKMQAATNEVNDY